MTMRLLQEGDVHAHLRSTLKTMSLGDGVPRNQTDTNRIGIVLAWTIARNHFRYRCPNLYALEGRSVSGKTHVADLPIRAPHHFSWRNYEFLVDVFLFGETDERREEPLVAAEIEAAPSQVVWEKGSDEKGADYFWDFEKLLYVDAPVRLFVARVSTGKTNWSGRKVPRGARTETRPQTLERTLREGFERCQAPGLKEGTTVVVVFPTTLTKGARVRIGFARGRSRLEFDDYHWSE